MVDRVLEFEYPVTSYPLLPNLFQDSVLDLFLIVSIPPLLVLTRDCSVELSTFTTACRIQPDDGSIGFRPSFISC